MAPGALFRRSVVAVVAVVVLLLADSSRAVAIWPVALGASQGLAASVAGPTAPGSVMTSCSAVVAGEVVIAWNAVPHASSYTIYTSTTGMNGTYNQIGVSTSTSYTTAVLALLSINWFEVSASIGTTWTSAKSPPSGPRLIAVTLVCA